MIERQTIGGRPATVAYLDDKHMPADKSSYAFVRVLFDDGGSAYLVAPPMGHPQYAAQAVAAWNSHRAKHREPYIPEPSASEPTPREQYEAWTKAISIIDESEVEMRDMIERGLSSVARLPHVRITVVNAVVDRLMRKIVKIRSAAIKRAFRELRARLGNKPVLGLSLAPWAHHFIREDARNIDNAIRTGLIAGLDNAEIARKVVGSMGLNGVDGVTEFIRHKIGHLGRAAIKASILRK
jgi:hypothetical protein